MTWPFENDTSKIERKLARRSLTAERPRNLVAIITIGLCVCLMALTAFVNTSMKEQTVSQIRDQYQSGCLNLSYADMKRLVSAGKFEQWGYERVMDPVRYMDANLSVHFYDEGMRALFRIDDITGKYPQKENEICVERSFLQYFSLPEETSRTVSLDLGFGKQDYMISGILEKVNTGRQFDVYISEALAAAQSEKPFSIRFRFAGNYDGEPEQLKADIQSFYQEMGIPEEDIFFSSNYFDMENLYLGSNLSVYAIAVLLAVACAAVIYNIFYISVMGKLREYGRLKVIGTTPRQLRQVVRRERRTLALFGIVSGLLIAAILSNLLYPGYWNWGENLCYTVIVVLAAVVIVVFSTWKPLQMAGKVSAIEAVRSSAYQSAPGPVRNYRRLSVFRLACMNFSRNRKQTILTVFSLGMTGILTICIASYASSVDVEEMARSSFGDGGDYILNVQDREDFAQTQREDVLGPDTRKSLLTLPGVDFITSYSAMYCTIAQTPNADAWHLVGGLTPEQMAWYQENDVVIEGTADYNTLLQNNGIVVMRGGEDLLKALYHMDVSLGDTVTLQSVEGECSKDYTVMGVVDTYYKGTGTSKNFTLPVEELHTLYPDIEDFTGFINIHTTKASDQQRQTLYALLEDPRIEIECFTDLIAVAEMHLRQMCFLLYGLLSFIALFALINLINTLITNLLTRRQESGIFQSVGMTSRQLSRMISDECLCYVIVTLLITFSIGTVCGIAVVQKFNQLGSFGRLTYHFPFVVMAVFSGALLVVYGAFRLMAVRFLQKQSLVERIKMVD